MPTYCAYTDLEYLTGSTLGQTILEAIITQAEAKLDARLAEAGRTGSGSSAICKAAALELSIAGVLTRGRMDGTKPSSINLGDLSMSDDIDTAIAGHLAEADRLIALYINSTANTSTVDISGTIVRADHTMEATHLDQSTVHEYHDQASTYGNQDDEVY